MAGGCGPGEEGETGGLGARGVGSAGARLRTGLQPPARPPPASCPARVPSLCAERAVQKQGRSSLKKKEKVEGVKCKRKGLVEKGERWKRGFVQKNCVNFTFSAKNCFIIQKL